MVEGFNESVNLIGLLLDAFPVFWKIIPLGIQFGEVFSLLFDPGKVLQVMDSTLVIVTELTNMGN